MGRIFFRDRDRTRVEEDIASTVCGDGDMGMSMEQDIAFCEFWEILLVVDMSVCGEHGAVAENEHSRVSTDGEVENHSIDLTVAVSTDADDLIGDRIELGDDRAWIVVTWQVVSRAVIENVTKEQELICFLGRKGVEHKLTVVCRAVNIGCDHNFHNVKILSMMKQGLLR